MSSLRTSVVDSNDAETRSVSVRVDGVKKTFDSSRGRHEALRSIDLEIIDGEFLTILGPSGCGKTTLLRILAGFEQPTSGDVFLDGTRITNVPPNKRPMAMVFQNYALFPHLTVFDNIAYGLKIAKVSKDEIRERVDVVLSIMDLVGLAGRLPTQLSGGQQQRVALARSVVIRPRVLLFDEPLSNLDARLRDQMRSELRRIQRQLGVTSVYVTHDQAEAMAMSDRVVVMSEGRIEQVGSPADVYRRPETLFVADFIGKANVLEAKVIDQSSGSFDIEVLGLKASIPAVPVSNHGAVQSAESESSGGEITTVVLRPEDISISPLPSPNDHEGRTDGEVMELPGWLRGHEYLVPASHLTLELLDGTLLSAVANHTSDFGPQTMVGEDEGVLVRIASTALHPVRRS